MTQHKYRINNIHDLNNGIRQWNNVQIKQDELKLL